MAPDKLKLLVLLGDEPVREWERRAIEALRCVEGVDVAVDSSAGHGTATAQDRHGGSLFRSFVQRAQGMLAHADVPGTSDARDAGGNANIILLLAGAVANGRKPKHGVWRFITEEGTQPHALPPGMCAALRGRSLVQFHLVDEVHGRLLRTGCFPVNGDPALAADPVLALAAHWPAQAAARLLRNAKEHGDPDEGAIPEPLRTDAPGNFTMLMHRVARWFGGNGADEGAGETVYDDWNIGLLHQPIHALLNEEASMNVRWFPAPGRGKGRVEPFGYRADGELNVLYRKTDNETHASTIARLRPKPDNILKRSRTMLATSTDHAYPFTVSIEGVVHALRTDLANNRTEISRINSANDGLEEGILLLPLALHAPTLFTYDGRWWIMGTRDPLPDAALHIYHGTSPFGPFVAHAMNPVKCDVRSSRPAGTPFAHNGALWRPALDASDRDAYAVVLNQVEQLSPEVFSETPHRRIDGFASTAYGMGVRTLCAMGDVTLVDGLRSPVVEGSKANASRGKRRKHRHKQQDDA